jgi:hypothetical protein
VSSVALRAPSNTPLHDQFKIGLPSFAARFTRLLVAVHKGNHGLFSNLEQSCAPLQDAAFK